MIPTTETLASEFSRTLRACLTPQQMNEVALRNRKESCINVCHSHDFCDANMVLYDVFMKHGMDPADEGGPDLWGDLWNCAWDLAKAREFQFDK